MKKIAILIIIILGVILSNTIEAKPKSSFYKKYNRNALQESGLIGGFEFNSIFMTPAIFIGWQEKHFETQILLDYELATSLKLRGLVPVSESKKFSAFAFAGANNTLEYMQTIVETREYYYQAKTEVNYSFCAEAGVKMMINKKWLVRPYFSYHVQDRKYGGGISVGYILYKRY